MAVEEGMKRVFFSQSLPQALTRDSQPGWLAGSREGPRLREGKPHGAQLQQTRRRRRRGARRLRAAAPRAAAAAAPGEASSAVSPDEQVPLTLWLSTRTRTRKTGRAPARGGAERGWAGGAQLPLVLLLLLLLLLRLLPRSPPPMGSACSGGSSGDADQTPGRKWTTCCSPQTCCCLPLPCVFIYFSSQRSYLGRDPIPFSPEVSLLKPYWTQSFFFPPDFQFLIPPKLLWPLPFPPPRSALPPRGSQGTWLSALRGALSRAKPPSIFIANRTHSISFAVVRQESLQFERQNKISHLGNLVRGFFLQVSKRWAGVGGSR